MENKILIQLTKIQDQINIYNILKQTLLTAKSRVEKQTLKIRVSNSRSRLYKLITDLKQNLTTEVLEITYTINGYTYYARLTNIKPDEVPVLFNLMSKVYNQNIEILEINKIPTFFSEGKL